MARILHIEDDPRNRLLVRKLLAADGHEVVDAPDGLEGVRLALTQRPDLVLVDLNIPGLDGYEVTLRLRTDESLRGVPIIAITAEGDRDTSFAVGCDGFVQKPIDARRFAWQVGQYLAGQRERRSISADATGERLRMQSGRVVAHLESKVAELSAANERLRDMDRLRTEYYRNISHELATPLTPIVGYIRMLIDEELGDLAKPQAKALRAMDDCVRRLRGVLDNLLDVTGLETGRMRFFHRDYDFLDTVRRALAAQADGTSSAASPWSRTCRAGRSPPSETPTASGAPSCRSSTTRRSSPPRGAASACRCGRSRPPTRSSSRTRVRACRLTVPSASSSLSTRSTGRPRARRVASGSGSRWRGGWRGGWAATCR